MRFIIPLTLAVSPLAAIPATTELTLVTESGFNQLAVSVDPQVEGVPFDLASSSSTTLTGSVTADFNVDTSTGQTSELTLRDGRVNGTGLRFRKSVRIILFNVQVYDIMIDGLTAAVFTSNPPGTVNPGTGPTTFAANQHSFSIDGGDVGGTVSIPGEPTVTIDEAFSPESPVEGTGSGDGVVTLTHTGDSGGFRNYDVIVTFPLTLEDAFELDADAVNITATGNIKAAGSIQVPLDPYIAWTIQNGIDGAASDDDSNGDGVPNGIAWALGYDASTNASASLPTPSETTPGAFQIVLPAGGTAAPLSLETSTTLASWLPVTGTRLSNGINPIPSGSTGTITVTPLGSNSEFIRLLSDE